MGARHLLVSASGQKSKNHVRIIVCLCGCLNPVFWHVHVAKRFEGGHLNFLTWKGGPKIMKRGPGRRSKKYCESHSVDFELSILKFWTTNVAKGFGARVGDLIFWPSGQSAFSKAFNHASKCLVPILNNKILNKKLDSRLKEFLHGLGVWRPTFLISIAFWRIPPRVSASTGFR